jgi:uncharacterized protein (TIGR02145 family)
MKIIITSILLAVIFITACEKEEVPVAPNAENASVQTKAANKTLTVTTTSVNVSSAYSVYANGSVSVSGGNNNMVSKRGFCWNASGNPTIASDTVGAGSGLGNFGAVIPGLSAGTAYYVKAFAINSSGSVYYGSQLSFTTLTLGMPSAGIGTVTDIDGNIYNTITLGTQVWMVENLKTTRYRDGTSITNVSDNAAWASATSGAYCDYNNDAANAVDYGRLYNLYAIKDSRNIAPAGWHLPNMSEWLTAINYLGGGGIAGGRMKEAGLVHWNAPNTGADNSSWFTALGSGFRSPVPSGSFYNFKNSAYFWSSSSNLSNPSSPTINSFIFNYNSADYTMQWGSISGGATYGYAVRCIKD